MRYSDLPPTLGVPGYVSGRYYTTMAASTANTAVSANNVYYIPFYVSRPTTFSRIAINCTVAAGNCRLGVYSDTLGRPGVLLLDSGDLVTAVGEVFKDQLFTLGTGWYWLASTFSGAPTVTCVGANPVSGWFMGQSAIGTTFQSGLGRSQTYAAFPSVAPLSGIFYSATPCMVALRAA